MQAQRILHQIFVIALLLFGSGCTSAAQSNQASAEFSEAELDQMLAPVALYPDSVLTHVLIAATYPLEVVQAARWLEQNPGLSGEAAVDAASGQDWDPSVQALVAFPQLLKRLNEDLNWTQQLGEAFISDEAALLASIQRLRQRAYAQGTLNKMEHVVVEREREIIMLEPARREVIYVPYYDTRVVYGNWWWPAYPPVYWYEPAGYRSHVTFYWGAGFSIRPSFYFSVFDWHRRHVVVHHHYHHKPPRYYPKRQHFQHASRWQHDNYHRRGVHYQHSKLRDRQDFYHSRPEQRRAMPARTAQQQAAWRAETERSTANRPNRPDNQASRDRQRRNQDAERAQRQQRETRFAERQRQAQQQQRQRTAEQRLQQPERQQSGRIAQQWAENEQRIQPIKPAQSAQQTRPDNRPQQEQRPQPISRPQQEQRPQPINRPQQEQRSQAINRPQQEQRPQPISRPQQEQRSQAINRPQQEQRPQPISRPQQEQRAQPISRPQQEQRTQPISRPQQEQRLQRNESGRSARVEQRLQRQQ